MFRNLSVVLMMAVAGVATAGAGGREEAGASREFTLGVVQKALRPGLSQADVAERLGSLAHRGNASIVPEDHVNDFALVTAHRPQLDRGVLPSGSISRAATMGLNLSTIRIWSARKR